MQAAWGVLKCEVQFYFLFISSGFIFKGEEKMGRKDLVKITKYLVMLSQRLAQVPRSGTPRCEHISTR